MASPGDPCATTARSMCLNLDHHEEVCPGCGGALAWETCHMTYTTWKCLGCGADLDSRVVGPELRHREVPCDAR